MKKLDHDQLRPNQRVRISFEGVVVPRDDVPGGCVIRTDDGAQWMYLPDSMTIEEVTDG